MQSALIIIVLNNSNESRSKPPTLRPTKKAYSRRRDKNKSARSGKEERNEVTDEERGSWDTILDLINQERFKKGNFPK